MLGLYENDVALVEKEYTYWDMLFQQEKEQLELILKGYAVTIEHVGSTAILQSPSKPIIDIAIGVKDWGCANKIKEILEINGYHYRANHGSEKRLLFVKMEEQRRTHHIHVEEFGGEDWNNHIDFRECMRKNPLVKEKYIQLKSKLSRKYVYNRAKYTRAKADFIKYALEKYRFELRK